MKSKCLIVAIALVLAAGCQKHKNYDPNNTMNVDENLTTMDVNATDMDATGMNATDMEATDLNASGSDSDVPAPPVSSKKRPHRP